MTDKLVGGILLLSAALILTYYTLWVVVTVRAVALLGLLNITATATGFYSRFLWSSALLRRLLQPFVDADNALQQFFPERKWAILLPTVAFVGAVTVAGTLIGLVVCCSARPKPKAA